MVGLFSIQAMVFDNRYFPLIQEPFITVPDRPSHLRADLFATTGSKANGARETYIGIPEMFGTFDLALLGRAFLLAGLPSPLTPVQTAAQLNFIMEGKIQTQGIQFAYYQQVFCFLGAGIYLMAMQSDSSLNFFFNHAESTLKPSAPDVLELEDTLRSMLAQLGLRSNHVHQSGFGDIDAYVRIGQRWEFLYKFRSIEAGLRVGVLVPTGVRRNIFQPASVSYGGDDYWGVYASLDSEFEIREDWKAGIVLRASKRFAGTHEQRMPADLEQPLFGVLTGSAQVTPGWTGIFSPYVTFENMRAGLGFRGQYTLIAHQNDRWLDQRLNKEIPANVCAWEKTSGWSSEYITLTGFYDFGKMKVERCADPIVVFSWYIPVALLVAKHAVRSYKVRLGLEYNF